MATFHDLTTAQLKQAVHLREQIESLQEKLDALLGGSSSTTAPKKKLGRPAGKVGRPKGKRTMSPATIAKMRTAQQARWAKMKSPVDEPVKTVAKKPASKKKVMSPEAKAKIAATMKARWEAKKKGEAAE